MYKKDGFYEPTDDDGLKLYELKFYCTPLKIYFF